MSKYQNLRLFIISFFCCVTLTSCIDTLVEDNLRVLVKGKVVDENNVPITNAIISVETDANTFDSNLLHLSQGTTDANGEFELTSLFGYNELFQIKIEKDIVLNV